MITFRRLALLALVATLISMAQSTLAQECHPADMDTPNSSFMEPNAFGSVAFAFDRLGAKVQVVETGHCYALPSNKKGGSIYFFFNHRSDADETFPSFIAVQIVKTFKNLRFVEDRVSGLRSGNWVKILSDEQIILRAIKRQRTFESLAPSEFRSEHLKTPFDESRLLESWGDYFHGLPEGADIRSDQRLSYWQQELPEGNQTKVENYLLRYNVLKLDEATRNFRAGIPFNSRFHKDTASMKLRLRTPALGSVYVDFELK